MVLFQTKVVKNFLTEKNVKRLNYLNLTVISSIILFLLGILYIIQYKNGNIVITKNTANRMLVLFDESNFLRFTAIFYTVLYFIKNPFNPVDSNSFLGDETLILISSKFSKGL